MATMAVQFDERTVLREIISSTELPVGIRFERMVEDYESTGEECWKIYYSVSPEYALTAENFAILHLVRSSIHQRALAAGIYKWPFVTFY